MSNSPVSAGYKYDNYVPPLPHDIPLRPMIQTRHSFATTALSLGENPLWIAKVMGHRDTGMIINVYAKYVENINGTTDDNAMNSAFQDAMGRK